MSELLDLAAGLAQRASSGEQVEVYLHRSASRRITARDDCVENVEITEGLDVVVRVVTGGRAGLASGKGHEGPSLVDALERARVNARLSTPDDFAGLAEPDGVTAPTTDAYDDGVERLTMDDRIARALTLSTAVRAADARIASVASAVWSDGWNEIAIASTAGIAAAERWSSVIAGAYAQAASGGDVQFGFRRASGRRPGDIDLDALAGGTAHAATRLLGASKPKTARLPVLFDPLVTADMLSLIGNSLCGDEVAFRRTPFADRVGESIAAPIVRIVDDVAAPRSPASRAFDDEGLASRTTLLVAGGVLEGFLHDSTSARRLSGQPTGSARRIMVSTQPMPAARGIRLEPTTSADELVRSVDDGLLVTAISGLHSGANPVSGDFSVGVTGLRIRGGEPAEAVREATVASTLQRMLFDIAGVGDDVDWDAALASPFGARSEAVGSTVLIGEMTLGGT